MNRRFSLHKQSREKKTQQRVFKGSHRRSEEEEDKKKTPEKNSNKNVQI